MKLDHLRKWFVTVAITAVTLTTTAFMGPTTVGQDRKSLSVKRVVLYNSGIGQIQHEGMVTGDQSVTLQFNQHDVSDVLKSLVFSDDGGSVSAINYQSAPKAEDIAANELGPPMTLAQLLQSHRGRTIAIEKSGKQIRGKIFGVETRTENNVNKSMIVLLNEQGLKSHDLSMIDQLTFEDSAVTEKLNLALQGVVQSQQAGQKELSIHFSGKGERDIKFAYVIDTPIWRMTYRLTWKNDKAYLQGWAHVDNVTGIDWKEIDLELRNGRPHAIHMDIFAPLLATRPNFGNSIFDFTDGLNLTTQWNDFQSDTELFTQRIANADDWNDSGHRFSGGFGGGFGGGGGLGGGGSGGGFGGGFIGGRSGVPAKQKDSGVDLQQSFAAAGSVSSAGPVVKYSIETPVNLRSGESAALPIVESDLPCKLYSLFRSAGEISGTPDLVIELQNDTDLALVSGPVSVLYAKDFVGDSKLPRLDRGEKTIMTYGIDNAVSISSTTTVVSPKKIVSIKIQNENISVKTESQATTTWTVHNRDSSDREVLLTTRHLQANETVSPVPKKQFENLEENVYLIKAPADQKTELALTYTQPLTELSPWLNATKLPFKSNELDNIDVDENDLARIKKAVELSTLIKATRLKRITINEKRKNLISDHDRIKKSVIVYGRETIDGKEEIKRLKKLDSGIEALQKEIEAIDASVVKLLEEKNKLLKN